MARWMRALVWVLAIGSAQSLVLAKDDAGEIPADFRGVWLLRLTSKDQGKTYLSGDGKPVVELGAKSIKALRDFDQLEAKQQIDKVTVEKSEGGNAEFVIDFSNGKRWRVKGLATSSIAVHVYASQAANTAESFRFVVRIQR